MPSISKIILTLILSILCACATTHPGHFGKATSKDSKVPLVLSATNIDQNPDGGFQLIEVTLENSSDSWLRIEKTEVVLGDPAQSKVSVVLGQDLKDWATAANFKQKLEEQNTKAIQASLAGAAVITAGVGETSGNDKLKLAGGLITIGTLGWALNDAIKATIASAEHSEKIPENHLYRPANIPAKMFIRRWILINKPAKKVVNNLVLRVKTIEGEQETYEINL